MKRVLVVATSFPPIGGRNCERVIKFSKYLPEFGWDPYVLTVSKSGMAAYDSSLEKELRTDTKIYRAHYPPVAKILSRIAEKINRQYMREKQIYSQIERRKFSKRAALYLKMFIARRIPGIAINLIRRGLFIPDDKIFWVLFAVIKGGWLCFRYKIDLIFSSAPSFTTHLAAMGIKLITKRKWVADYRDLWTNNPNIANQVGFRRRYEKILDGMVIKKADSIITVSRQWKEYLVKDFPFLKPQNTFDIPNGYDFGDFDHIEFTDKEDGIFRISHTGVITDNYPTLRFLKAARHLIEKYPELKNRLRIDLLGYTHSKQKQEIKEILEELGMHDIVYMGGMIDRAQALIRQKNSQVLLLLYGGHGANVKGMIPSKLFDYIAAKRPILGILPECRAAEIIRKGRCGFVVSNNDTDKITKALLKIYMDFKSNRLKLNPNWEYLKQFDRRNLTSRLVDVFNNLYKAAK